MSTDMLIQEKKADEMVKQPDDEQTEYKVYSYRYWIGLLYFFPNVANAAAWITFSPITPDVHKIYEDQGISTFLVNLVSLSYMIVYPFVNFPANWIIDDYGLRLGMFIGTLCTITGLLLRMLVNQSFYWVIAGAFIGGIGQPFILNSPAKIAAQWFGPQTRPLATAVLAMINPIGTGIGFLIPGFFVKNIKNDIPTPEQINTGRDQVFNLMLYEGIVMAALCVPTLFLFKSGPPTPPSEGAATEKIKFVDAFKELKQNKNYWLLFCGFSCMLGGFNTFGTIISQILMPFGFGDSQVGVFGAMFIFSGLIGAAMAGIYVENTLQYKRTLLIIACGFWISTFILLSGLFSENPYLMGVEIFLAGFVQTPILPMGLDFSCEIAFPLGEAILSGILVTGGQLLSVIQVVLIDFVFFEYIPDQKTSILAVICFIGAFGIAGFLCMSRLKEDLRRAAKEKNMPHLALKKESSTEFRI